MQYNSNAFTGNIQLQASMDAKSVVDSNSFTTISYANCANVSGSNYFNFQGKYRAVRFKVSQISGQMNYIYYRP